MADASRTFFVDSYPDRVVEVVREVAAVHRLKVHHVTGHQLILTVPWRVFKRQKVDIRLQVSQTKDGTFVALSSYMSGFSVVAKPTVERILDEVTGWIVAAVPNASCSANDMAT